MARKLFESQGIRKRSGSLATGVVYVVYSNEAGTVLADISATSGASATSSSTVVAGTSRVTTANIAGLAPAALRFYGPDAGTDTLYVRVPSDTNLGVQKIQASTDDRLDVLEAAGGGDVGVHAADTTAVHGITDTAQVALRNAANTFTADQFFTSGRPWFGVGAPTGVGATDTAAIQAAIDAANAAGGGTVQLAGGTYKITSLNLKSGVGLVGSGLYGNAAGTTLEGTAGSDIVTLPTSAGGHTGMGIARLTLSGGRRCIASLPADYNTHVFVDQCQLTSASAELVYLGGANEEWRFYRSVFQGGTYGCRVIDTVGNNPLFDKSQFIDCVFNGQSINNVLIQCRIVNSIQFSGCVFGFNGQDSVVLDGNLRAISFLNCNTEQGGNTMLGVVSRGTGSMVAASNQLTSVTQSGPGFVNGQTITVEGAGLDGRDLVTTISSGGGTATLTLGTAASTSVTGSYITNAIYSDFKIVNSLGGGAPNQIAFFCCVLGQGEGLRYMIDNTIGSTILCMFVQGSGEVPAYDPYSRIMGIGPMQIRQPFLPNATIPMGFGAFGGAGAQRVTRSSWATPPGGTAEVWLVDSDEDFTGTYGEFRVRKANGSSGSIAFSVQDDGDVVQWDAAGRLYAQGKVIALSGLGVGNSAVATTPGTVVRKMQVFDGDSNSLGFIPIYDAIT